MATKIRCKYLDCAFLDEGYCISAQIDLDSDKGCLTYQSNDDLPLDENLDEIDNIKISSMKMMTTNPGWMKKTRKTNTKKTVPGYF